MTMICAAKNKAELKEKLERGCNIIDPRPEGNDYLNSETRPVGFREPVCLDPETRRRFAVIEKTVTGWKVK